MPTVREIAEVCRCSISDVQRAARALGIAAKSPAFEIKADDSRRLTDALARQAASASPATGAEASSGAEAGSETTGEPVGARSGAASPVGSPVAVRERPGAVRGAGAHPVLLHEAVVDWLATADPRIKRRFNLVLRHLVVFGRTGIVKTTARTGGKWLRTPLGGPGGMQWYLWWAPAASIGAHQTPAATPGPANAPMERGSILVRAIRHHDDLTLIDPGVPERDYIPLPPDDLVNRREDYGFAFAHEQEQVARSRSPVRFVRGQPGAGKTSALWLAASHAVGRQGLYVTFSERLRADAARYIDALGPRDLPIRTLTFDALATLLAGPDSALPARLDPADAVLRLSSLLRTDLLRSWADRPDFLYAELHAYLVGHALPFPFRDLPAAAGPTLDRGVYRALRGDEIGRDPAKAAAAALASLPESARRELFAGPLIARQALDRLLGGSPLPRALEGCDFVFVDEVQDLTLVEQALLVVLCSALGKAGGRPPAALVVAGDEGQTVLPTDFEWGKIADLATARLGPRLDFTLQTNVRCPANLATVVNRSSVLYRHFAKADRPRGQSEVAVDDATAGRVLVLSCRTPEDLKATLEFFERTPDSALVLPGQSIPEPLRHLASAPGAILTACEAKGLEFRTVGVLGMSAALQELAHLGGSGTGIERLAALVGRQRADQLRVALSRATENLVLIDLDQTGADRARIASLLRDVPWAEAEAQDLQGLLAADCQEPAEIALAFCVEAARLLGRHPARAYQRVCQALAVLGAAGAGVAERGSLAPGEQAGPEFGEAVNDPARCQAWTVRAEAALDLALSIDRERGHHGRDDLLRDAQESYWRVGRRTESATVLHMRDLAEMHPDDLGAAEEAASILESLPVLTEPLAGAARAAIRQWLANLAEGFIFQIPADQVATLRFARQCYDDLGRDDPALEKVFPELLAKSARTLCAAGFHQQALAVLELLPCRDDRREATCVEHLGDHAEAARRFEKLGAPGDALRNWRLVPDLPNALRVAEAAGHADLEALRWLADVVSLLGTGQEEASRLTGPERSLLQHEATKAVARGELADRLRQVVPPVPPPEARTLPLPWAADLF